MAKIAIEHGSVDLSTFNTPPVLKANTAHTLTIDDIGGLLQFTNAGAVTLTIPLSKSLVVPIGATATLVQDGTGKVTIAGAAGVTVNGPGGLLGTSARYAEIWATKVDTDRWIVAGSVG